VVAVTGPPPLCAEDTVCFALRGDHQWRFGGRDWIPAPTVIPHSMRDPERSRPVTPLGLGAKPGHVVAVTGPSPLCAEDTVCFALQGDHQWRFGGRDWIPGQARDDGTRAGKTKKTARDDVEGGMTWREASGKTKRTARDDVEGDSRTGGQTGETCHWPTALTSGITFQPLTASTGSKPSRSAVLYRAAISLVLPGRIET